ncbi:MAG: accessory factor UbiK family protein [Rhodospirillales bacterium]|nr:accessory factor UbiK family protein [Rhodospirillales bacterium]
MSTRNRIFDDLAKMSTGAASTLLGLRDEVATMVRGLFDRVIADGRFVDRDEFDAVKAMAAKARAEQERLEDRVAALDGKPRSAKRRTAPKPAKTKARSSRPRR